MIKYRTRVIDDYSNGKYGYNLVSGQRDSGEDDSIPVESIEGLVFSVQDINSNGTEFGVWANRADKPTNPTWYLKNLTENAIVASADGFVADGYTLTDSENFLNITIPLTPNVTRYAFTEAATYAGFGYYSDNDHVDDYPPKPDYIGLLPEINLIVESFSTTINNIELYCDYANIKVPEYLPPNMTDLDYMFDSCYLFNQDISMWDTSHVTTMAQTFYGTTLFNQDLSTWDTSNVTDMSLTFSSALSFNQDLSDWNVSNVTAMYDMFSDATSFNGDVSTWNTSNVTDMSYMFDGATLFNQDISSWDTSSVTDMGWMFRNATSFNSDISNWDVGQVTSMWSMFDNAAIFNQDISGWDVGNVTSMFTMFNKASSFNQDISNWNVSSVTDMSSMFNSARAFNQDLSKWCVKLITSKPFSFDDLASVWTLPRPVWGTCPRGEDGGEEPDDSDLPDGIPLRFTVNNLDNQSGDMPFIVNLTTFNPDYTWSIYKDGKLFVDANTIPEDAYVRDDNYFAGKTTYSTSVTLPMQRNTINEYLIYSDVNSVEITSNGNSDEINPRAVTVIEFSDSITEHLFPSNYVLFTVPNELPSYLRSTKSMFFNNKLFNQDISTWDTSNIMDMNSMFAYATSFDQDISHWDVSNVAGMESMFTGATSFNQNLSGWSVSNIPSVPSGFIYSTDSWILPKPVWGTSPLAGVLTEPEIPLTFNVDTDVSIKITVSDVSTGDWKLFKNDVLIARPGISRDGSSVSIDSSKKITVKIYTSGHVGLNEYKLYAEGNAVLIDEQTGELTDEFTITEFSNRCKEVIVGFSKAKVVVTADLPSSITSTLGMFRYCEIFNSDISHWDVSNVTNMDYMFHWARTFNQDLSKWCVSNIPSLPLGFDLEATAWTLPKPVWGTCPRGEDV